MQLHTPFRRFLKWGLALAAVVVFGLAHWYRPIHVQTRFHAPASAEHAVDSKPFYESDFVSLSLNQYVHSASVTWLPSGGLQAVWFGGTREGARDVNIYSARFDTKENDWGANAILADRASTERALGRAIRKLGNPVIGTAPDGRLWLFYVSASVGGWGGSAINFIVSDDEGRTWSLPKRLITSPFFNISTLVRGQPVFHEDGTIGLPVYHQFLGKFPEYLRLDRNGRVIDKTRMNSGRGSLQPSVVVLDATRAVSVLRYAGDLPGRVLVSETRESGASWSAPRPAPVPNPNSGLSAVRYSEDEVLVALNDLEKGRHRLTLYLADNSLSKWQRIKVIEESPDPMGKPIADDQFKKFISAQFLASDDDSHQNLLPDYLNGLDERMCDNARCEFGYAYPYLMKGPEGRFHLVYTWNKSMIKHIEFNRAWLEQYR